MITIDLVESLDAYRETLRVRLGEPYRTMLGHFRHEADHYYQNILVETGPGAQRYLARCRDLFGDERASYADELARHYEFGAPPDWQDSYISEYATMHPWEDFAECFAHYLHITDTIDTAREAGMVLHVDRVRFTGPRDIVPLESYADAPIDRLLFDWKWMSLFFNRVNTAMGKNPLYPFEIGKPVADKLGFVHEVVRGRELPPPPAIRCGRRLAVTISGSGALTDPYREGVGGISPRGKRSGTRWAQTSTRRTPTQPVRSAYRWLAASRKQSLTAGVVARFTEIDGGTQAVVVSVQLFTTVIPLIIIGFDFLSGSPRARARAH